MFKPPFSAGSAQLTTIISFVTTKVGVPGAEGFVAMIAPLPKGVNDLGAPQPLL